MSRGGNGAVAEERSSAKAVEEIAANPTTAKRVLLTMRTSLFLPDARSHRHASMWVRSVCGKRRHAAASLAEGAYSRMARSDFGRSHFDEVEKAGLALGLMSGWGH